jgi:hypothetical protein
LTDHTARSIANFEIDSEELCGIFFYFYNKDKRATLTPREYYLYYTAEAASIVYLLKEKQREHPLNSNDMATLANRTSRLNRIKQPGKDFMNIIVESFYDLDESADSSVYDDDSNVRPPVTAQLAGPELVA